MYYNDYLTLWLRHPVPIATRQERKKFVLAPISDES
jgi:hypothetical protein